jgi:predicted amidohydrolase YtcJ
MQSMVERTTATGMLIGAEERVDADTALAAYTTEAAWAAGEEHRRGRLAPGQLADFVVLGDDVTAVPSSQIATTEVIATFTGGSCTHGEEAVAAAP